MTDRWKLAQVPQLVAERPHRKHAAESAWPVPQCGHRHVPIWLVSLGADNRADLVIVQPALSVGCGA
jgi:hypothetical protein